MLSKSMGFICIYPNVIRVKPVILKNPVFQLYFLISILFLNLFTNEDMSLLTADFFPVCVFLFM